MKKKILTFGGSNSKTSINKRFAFYAASLVKNSEVNLLDLNDFEMPIFSVDKEKESGIPNEAHNFKQHIINADGIIISFAEHNGAYSAAFKNIYDWVSRIEGNVWMDKPMLLLATSPGGRGGKSVLEIASNRFGHSNKNLSGTFSLPQFYENFNNSEGIIDSELEELFNNEVNLFTQKISS